MCRKAREKNEKCIYHVMTKSCSEFKLFKENFDKDAYLNIVKKNILQYNFKIYAYCLMSNHTHMIIDSNGADISMIMHSINQSYAQYFNKKYQRRGPVFQDRFRSIIVSSNSYLTYLSAYIHRNPKDIKRFENCFEKYKYSSLGYYLGISENIYGLVDKEFILRLMFNDSNDKEALYKQFVERNCTQMQDPDVEFMHEKSTYISGRRILYRNKHGVSLLNVLSSFLNKSRNSVYFKCKRDTYVMRCLYSALLRSFCNLSYRQICDKIGNITISAAQQMCMKGFNILEKDSSMENLIAQLIAT